MIFEETNSQEAEQDRVALAHPNGVDGSLSPLVWSPLIQLDLSLERSAGRSLFDDELRQEHDWILIDSPAGIERGFRNAIAPADMVLVVTNPEVSAVRDADRIIGLVEAEEKGPARLLINRIKAEMVKRGDMLSADDVLELLAIELIGMVPEDENVITSTNRGIPIALDGKSRAGQAFRNIARRLHGDEVPFLSMDHEGGFFGRLSRLIRSGGD